MGGRYDSNPSYRDESNPFADSRPSSLPREGVDYGDDSRVDIPLDSAADLRAKERNLKAKEAELNKREEVFLTFPSYVRSEEKRGNHSTRYSNMPRMEFCGSLDFLPKIRRTDGAMMFGVFFFTYTCHIIFCVFASIAPPMIFKGKSLTGILPAFDVLPANFLIGCLYFIGFGLFALESVISIWVLQEVFRYFRVSGKADEARSNARRTTQMIALGHA
ncbi:hypothetical protein L2E82_15640 [Cichorium intybus]|uniref:Uncharacterized protein n=1 Tax=Cichorium intybus TaxID=13427 RepID=A0ACB9F3C0_CICIN|nr:hypothetical protein L2E82_15640 [Cichorium intybus]